MLAAGVFLHPCVAQDLQIRYGAKGIQRLSYRGVELSDVAAHPSETFHIWHMRSTDLAGNPLTAGQGGWGETNNGEQWDQAQHVETYTFQWGTIETHFAQSGNDLSMEVVETNRLGSGIIFDGAEIYPITLHFPVDPTGFHGYTQFVNTTTEPGVSVAEYGSGRVTSIIIDEGLPLYGGWKQQGTDTYSPILAGTFPDGIATFLPHTNLPLAPGKTLRYRVILRFTPSGVDADSSEASRAFAEKYPYRNKWKDRRIIGTAFLSSASSSANITRPAGFSKNPRRYFTDSSLDVTSVPGLLTFQRRILAQAQTNVKNAQRINAQGVITWDIEGEEYPQSTSYVCSPDQTAAASPEMETIVNIPGSPLNGKKLDDAYFGIMSSADLRIGVCLRPQVFAIQSDRSAKQSVLGTKAQVIANLERKANYAHARWGATIFYVDSTVDAAGGTLDPDIFQQVTADLPSFLFVSEESTPRYYAYTAPFYSFLFHTDLGTTESIRRTYPEAFGANLINDVSPALLAQHFSELVVAVSHGDILMGHVDAWHPNNDTLLKIYAAAQVK